jgi:uncharacterized protein
LSVISHAKVMLLALLLCWAQQALADVAVPPLTGRIVDLTGTLSNDDIAAQSQRLAELEKRKGSQIAVLMLPTTQPETMEQYSIRVAEAWKIGRKKADDGVLLIIAKNDHKVRIEVGDGLEGALTDVTSRRIIDETITPRFRTGDFAGGIAAGLTRIIGVIDGEPLPAPAPEAAHGQEFASDALSLFTPFLIIFAIMAGNFLRAVFGRLLGSTVAGGVIGVIAWLLVGSLVVGLVVGGAAFLITMIAGSLMTAAGSPGRGRSGGSSRSSSSWSGGGGWSGGSSSSSSSSSSDSGFSGGGGDFSGGGATGSW